MKIVMPWLLCLVACGSKSDPEPQVNVRDTGTADGSSPPTPPVWSSPTAPGHVEEEVPLNLRINELCASNDSLVADGALDYDDWIELHNPTDAEISLAGWGLSDGGDSPDWFFEDAATIAAGGLYVVWADDEPGEGPDHATFGLDKEGDGVTLFDADGEVVDEVEFEDLPTDVVFGRFGNGLTWATSIHATPYNLNPVDPGLSTDPSDLLYPTDALIVVELFLDDDNYNALLDDRDARVKGDMAFQGAYLRDVGVTIKGALGSGRDLDDKSAFRLNFDVFVAGQRLRGLEHLTLNNMVQDPTYTHETLAYQLHREAGVPAPRVAHALVYLNGEYRGVYLNIETADDQFLQRSFADSDGNLYEGAYGADLTPSDRGRMELDELGSDDVDDRSDLISISDFLAQTPREDLMPEFEARMDLDSNLKMMATEILTGHWDGYFYSANNYRVYHTPSTDKWTLLPSGNDQTFDREGELDDASGRIGEFCLGIPSCKSRFDLALWEMAERMLDMECSATTNEIYDRVVDWVALDTYKEDSLDDMVREIGNTVEFCESFPYSVLDEIFPNGVP